MIDSTEQWQRVAEVRTQELSQAMAQLNSIQDGPRLAMATTKELLEEVSRRMRLTQNSTRGRELGAMCDCAVQNLSSGVLACKGVTQ